MFQIDACGRSCPEPVVMLKKAFDGGETNIKIVVDNNTAKENVGKFFKAKGFSFETQEEGETYIVTGKK